jgi:hypothetical protein
VAWPAPGSEALGERLDEAEREGLITDDFKATMAAG